MIREGGSLPILPMFRKRLKADCLMLGFASPHCNAHGPNEKARIPDLDRGAEAVARLFQYVTEKTPAASAKSRGKAATR
jgi:acetylornithine deacetylase/succinyl-diaminopimelate desuccinylase-like protein